jgi:hypothetical protein
VVPAREVVEATLELGRVDFKAPRQAKDGEIVRVHAEA